jgi:hypothetical protein
MEIDMANEIFWTTIVIVIVISFVILALGRLAIVLLPKYLHSNANFYLAPAIGLAILIIVASYLGNYLPFNKLAIVLWIAIIITIVALIRRKILKQVIKDSLIISAFGMFCAASLLGLLFVFGGYNAHNDAFTYLAHGDWLQDNAFSNTITIDKVSPLNSQIYLYQSQQLRMGGSFLLAMIQTLFNINWAYNAYSGLIIVGLEVACLSLGFILAQTFPNIKRLPLLALIAMPAFGLGGLVFATNFGFLPEIIGLALGVALLSTLGFILNWIVSKKPSKVLLIKAAVVIAILFSGVVYAYSEIVPFVALTIGLSAVIVIIKHRVWKSIVIFYGLMGSFSLVILNNELIRAYMAIKSQFGSVVGSAVPWPTLGFVAHIFGLHGGAWDIFQWSKASNVETGAMLLGFILLIGSIALLALAGKGVLQSIKTNVTLPLALIVILFFIGIFYFRYCVISPFEIGKGQSWSEFKLADWANPFVVFFVLFAIASLQPRLKRYFSFLVVAIAGICLVMSMYFGYVRNKPLVKYYSGTRNLSQYYQDVRSKIMKSCADNQTIYLDFPEQDLKFRQMVLLYLNDRDVRSNWANDGYIYGGNQERKAEYCMVDLNLVK